MNLFFKKISNRFTFRSNLRLKPFLDKIPLHERERNFWYFHDSIHFKELTFRNQKCGKNSDCETYLRRQLSQSILKNANYLIINNNWHQFSIQKKLYILDTISIIHGTNHKNTINYFDSLRPQIIFELQKQDFYVLLQLLYFSSIITTDNRNDHNFMIKQITERIEDFFLNDYTKDKKLFSYDIAVLSEYLFALKVKFSSKSILNLFSNLVFEDIQNNRMNRLKVISIIKFMRINEYCDPNLYNSIKSYVKLNSKQFLFKECAHIIAFFANLSLYDKHVYHYLVNERAHQLINCDSIQLSNGEELRSKDLARLLWAVSLINHKLDENIINCFIKRIESLISKDFIIYPHFLLDCIKSLIIMGIFNENLLLNALSSESLHKLFSNSKREKLKLDLYFILESISIERPDIKLEKKTFLYSIAKQPHKSITIEYKYKRHNLYKFLKLIENHQNYKKLRVDLRYTLQHIGIASIAVNNISLEVIDSTLVVNNDLQYLNGLIKTKIRQMAKRDIAFKLIYISRDVEEFLESIKNS